MVAEAGTLTAFDVAQAFSVALPLANEAKTLHVRVDSGSLVAMSPCKTPFYDADGKRQTADLTEVA